MGDPLKKVTDLHPEATMKSGESTKTAEIHGHTFDEATVTEIQEKVKELKKVRLHGQYEAMHVTHDEFKTLLESVAKGDNDKIDTKKEKHHLAIKIVDLIMTEELESGLLKKIEEMSNVNSYPREHQELQKLFDDDIHSIMDKISVDCPLEIRVAFLDDLIKKIIDSIEEVENLVPNDNDPNKHKKIVAQALKELCSADSDIDLDNLDVSTMKDYLVKWAGDKKTKDDKKYQKLIETAYGAESTTDDADKTEAESKDSDESSGSGSGDKSKKSDVETKPEAPKKPEVRKTPKATVAVLSGRIEKITDSSIKSKLKQALETNKAMGNEGQKLAVAKVEMAIERNEKAAKYRDKSEQWISDLIEAVNGLTATEAVAKKVDIESLITQIENFSNVMLSEYCDPKEGAKTKAVEKYKSLKAQVEKYAKPPTLNKSDMKLGDEILAGEGWLAFLKDWLIGLLKQGGFMVTIIKALGLVSEDGMKLAGAKKVGGVLEFAPKTECKKQLEKDMKIDPAVWSTEVSYTVGDDDSGSGRQAKKKLGNIPPKEFVDINIDHKKNLKTGEKLKKLQKALQNSDDTNSMEYKHMGILLYLRARMNRGEWNSTAGGDEKDRFKKATKKAAVEDEI
jgi:hypothetical protein